MVVAAAFALAGCATTPTPDGTSTSRVSGSSTTAPKGSGAPVTSTQMAAIVSATMATNNKANRSLDLTLLKSYETGSALAIDAASYRESAQLADSACEYPPFGLKVLQAVAEGGASYPQRFVVLASSYPLPQPSGCSSPGGSCPHADSIFSYERASAGAPWKITLEPSADSGDIVHLDASDGAAGQLSASDASAARELPPALATDLESYEATGGRGPLQASYFTGTCWLIPDPRAALEQYRKSAVTSHQVYSPASDQVSVPVAGGGALTIFTLDFETSLLPASAGGTIDWVAAPTVEPVTGLLPSGQYRSIEEKGALQIAAETGPAGKFTIVGSYDGITSVTGTLGAPGQGGGGGVLVSYVVP